MERLILSKQEIDNIRKIKNFDSGSYGVVVPYENGLALKFSRNIIDNGLDSELENKQLYISEYQIKKLVDRQSKIKLTSLPKGVAYYDNIPVAVIIKYFKNYHDLYEVKNENHHDIINVFQQLLYIIDELINNGIYQFDIKENNFLYSPIDFNVQAIDLDGPFINISEENIFSEELVYKKLMSMMLYLAFNKINLDNYTQDELDNKLEYLQSLKTNIYGYYSINGIINVLKNSQLLDPSVKIKTHKL